MRKHLWVGLVVSGVCLYFAFRGIALSDLTNALQQARPAVLISALGLYAFDFLLRTKRWSLFVRQLVPVKSLELFWVLCLGFFANNILPFRMGELARAHICGTKLSISRSGALGTIVVERLCDALSFVGVFTIASAFFPFPGYMKKGALLLGASALAAALTLVLMHHQTERFQKILARVPLKDAWRVRLEHTFQNFVHSTAGALKPGLFTKAMLISVVIWSIEAAFLALVARAFGVMLSYPGAFFLLFALGLSVALPQAPGYVGTFEFFGVTALAFLGVPKEQGLPVILTVHGLQFAFLSLLGAIGLSVEGLSFKSLTSTEKDR